MPEESEILEQTPEEQRLSEAQIRNQHNVANNASNISNLANVASKSANPYARAAGNAVKAADKLTGGKASQNIGKKVNQLSKLSPQGRMLQKASKLAGGGTASRIGQALSKKNSNAPTTGNVGGKSAATVKDKDNGFFSKKEVHEQTSDGGGVSFKATVKFLKIGLIAFAPIMVVVVFMNLIVAGSQTYLSVIGLGKADKITNDQAETAIRDNGSEGLDEEITDDNVNEGSANINVSGNTTGYIYDEFIEDSVFKEKFSRMNFVATTKSRPFNEADLTELKDYYSDINSYENGNYDMNYVYLFFFKLLYIERHYKKYYGIKDLDMPLIMSVLTVQSTDMSDVFVSNTKGYKIESEEEGIREDYKYFKYDYDWSNHIISKNDSSHDIEILAQGMVKRTSDSGCSGTIDGACYDIVEVNEYKEFLKGFLEKKYFLDGGHKLNEGVTNDNYTENSDGTNPMATEMIRVALNEYNNRNNVNDGLKYSKAYGFNSRVEWCAAFVWYVSANTKYNGKSLYPDIIPFKSASTGTYMNYFNSSNDNNLNFYYNDNCKKLAGKNNSDIKYIPKPGDYIFFDWSAKFSRVGDGTQDHTAMVEKYENGKVYTIEGNSGDKLARLSYSINDCRIIGYGSWY